MNKVFICSFILCILLSACKKEETKSPSYNSGEMTILTDDSFLSVTQALADGYMMNYPDTKIEVKSRKEDLAFLDLLNDKSRVIVMSRELQPNEISEYEKQVELKYQPAKFAADAVVFVVPKGSQLKQLTLEEIASGLKSKSRPFIFDGTNSSNLNFIAQYFNEKPKNLEFSIINGNENLIENLRQHPSKIGVIGYNAISRPYDKKSQQLRDQIEILPIVVKGKSYQPDLNQLKSMEYPFTRVLYFLVNESGFNLANGFIRFSCTQIGQKIVEKEGLQPYNLYGREVQMR